MQKQTRKKLRVAVNECGRRIGESHPQAVLTDDDVELIRSLRAAGLSLGVIARKFEVDKSTVQRIVTFNTRCQVADDFRTVPVSIDKVESQTVVHPVLGEPVTIRTYTFRTGEIVHRYPDGMTMVPVALSGRTFAKLQSAIRDFENGRG